MLIRNEAIIKIDKARREKELAEENKKNVTFQKFSYSPKNIIRKYKAVLKHMSILEFPNLLWMHTPILSLSNMMNSKRAKNFYLLKSKSVKIAFWWLLKIILLVQLTIKPKNDNLQLNLKVQFPDVLLSEPSLYSNIFFKIYLSFS